MHILHPYKWETIAYRRESDSQEGEYQNAITSNYPWTEDIIITVLVTHKQIIWMEDSIYM